MVFSRKNRSFCGVTDDKACLRRPWYAKDECFLAFALQNSEYRYNPEILVLQPLKLSTNILGLSNLMMSD